MKQLKDGTFRSEPTGANVFAILGKRTPGSDWAECSPARYETRAIAEHQAGMMPNLHATCVVELTSDGRPVSR